MTPQQWQTAWRLYQSCVNISPNNLQAFLRSATGDAEVRDAILNLLDRTRAVESLDRIGRRIGRYVLTGRLGAGGMGEVYAAQDSELGRPVAVKLVGRPEAGESSPVARFIQEAKAASALNHPNIVTIYEVIHADSRLAIVMELVDGMSLRELCGSPLPVDRVLHIGQQIARALAAAHARGIVHCDIKPENLMLRPDGFVKVLDFGLAQDLSSNASTSMVPAGTLRYMSPEQSRGEPASPASDVFCLGIVLYELTSGSHPFERGSIFDTLKALNEAEPLRPSSRNAFVPPQHDALLLRMLAKDPSQRPAMSEVARMLASHFSNQPSGLAFPPNADSISPGKPPASVASKAAARAAGKRWWIGVAALMLLALAGGVSWWAFTGRRDIAFEPIPLTTLQGSEEAPSFSPDGSQVAYRGNQHKQWDIYVKVIGGGGPPLRLTSDGGVHWYPAWSTDGKWMAFTARHDDGRNGLFLMPALGGPERLLAELDGEWMFAHWSPDGKWIAVSPQATANFDPGSGVTLISADTGERRDLVKQDAVMAQSAFGCFSPDGRRLAFLKMRGAFGQLYVADLTPGMRLSGHPRQIVPADALFPAWTADGREIVFMQGFATSNGTLARVNANGGPVRKIHGLGYTAGPIGIAHKGDRMAFSHGGIDYDIWRFDTRAEEAPRKLIASTVTDVAGEYSPDGKKIAFSSNRSGPREIWVSEANGADAVQLTRFGGPITGTARWSPDGRWIAFDSRPRGFPDIFVIGTEGSGLRRLTYPGEDEKANRHGMWQPAWSPDGKWIYFSSDRSGRFEIWRMPSIGGPAELVTKAGGSSAYPGRDSEWIYYVSGQPGPLRRIKPDGSADAVVVNRPIILLQYTAIPGGIYFVVSSEHGSQLQRLQEDGKIENVLDLPFTPGLGLSLSQGGRYALLTKPDENGTDLMLVEGFR